MLLDQPPPNDPADEPSHLPEGDRTTPPVKWRRLRVRLESVPTLTEQMVALVSRATQSEPRVKIIIDGFDDAFRDPRAILTTLSRRDRESARWYEVELVCPHSPTPIVVSFTARRRAGATLTLKGGERVLRNGLRPDLKAIIDGAAREEARRRRKAAIRRCLGDGWVVAGVLCAAITAAATVLILLHAP